MIKKDKHYIYPDAASLAAAATCEFEKDIKRLLEFQEYVNIALSGGTTPLHFYRALAGARPDLDWLRIRFFWGDERCVPPEHPDSNYGNAFRNLLDPLRIAPSAVFRIRGENDPGAEAKRYASVIKEEVNKEAGIPSFDWIFLGMGSDGHTLSIFPDQIGLWNDPELCVVTTHPETGQKRISFTGKLIHASKRVTLMVTGEDKSSVVNKVIFRKNNYRDYPASLINTDMGMVEWYLDKPAAKLFA